MATRRAQPAAARKKRGGRRPTRLDGVDGSRLVVPLTSVERDALEDALARERGRESLALSEWARQVLLAAAASARPRFKPRSLKKPIDLTEQVEALERAAVVAALAKTGDNQTHAATLLGVSRRTLIVKLEKYGLKARPRHGA